MILNTSPLDADVSFCFLQDSRAEAYLLDPPTMLLKPGQSEELTIWAYPKVTVTRVQFVTGNDERHGQTLPFDSPIVVKSRALLMGPE